MLFLGITLSAETLICNINQARTVTRGIEDRSQVSEFLRKDDTNFTEISTDRDGWKSYEYWKVVHEDKYFLILHNIMGQYSDEWISNMSLDEFKEFFNDRIPIHSRILTFSKKTGGVTKREIPLVCPYPWGLAGYEEGHFNEDYVMGMIWTGQMFYSASEKEK